MYKKLKTELEKLKVQNDLLTNLLSTFNKNANEDKIVPGCRVRIEYDSGKIQEGRVSCFSQNKGQWLINRDGYVGTIGVPNEQIKLVYRGMEGLIDLKLWENSIRYNVIENILKNSDLPVYLKDKDYVNILTVGLYKTDNDYCLMDFQILGYTPVLRIKVFNQNFNIGDYYQLQIKNEEILDIRPISKERYYNQE